MICGRARFVVRGPRCNVGGKARGAVRTFANRRCGRSRFVAREFASRRRRSRRRWDRPRRVCRARFVDRVVARDLACRQVWFYGRMCACACSIKLACGFECLSGVHYGFVAPPSQTFKYNILRANGRAFNSCGWHSGFFALKRAHCIASRLRPFGSSCGAPGSRAQLTRVMLVPRRPAPARSAGVIRGGRVRL